MKKVYLIFSLITLHLSLAQAQNWLWGIQGKSPGLADVWAAAADNKGNVYQAGYFPGIMSFGKDTLTTSMDGSYLIKIDSSGKVLWVKQSSSANGSAYGSGVSIDLRGNAYVTGDFFGTVYFAGDTIQDIIPATFLVKYDSSGNVLWAEQSSDLHSGAHAHAVSADSWDNAYVTGAFSSIICFANDTLRNTNINNGNVFLVKYDSAGKVLWARQSVGFTAAISGGESWAATADVSGNVYVTGDFKDTISFGGDTLAGNPNGGAGDAFLVKYDSAGNVLWARQSVQPPNSSSYDQSFSVAEDIYGSTYITGSFQDTISFGGNMLVGNAVGNAFLVKYSSGGNVLWAKKITSLTTGKYFGGSSVACDKFGHLFFSGGGWGKIGLWKFIYGTDTLTSPPASKEPSVIMELDTAGNVFCSSVISGGGDDQSDLVCDSLGKYVYLSGDILDTITFGKDFLSVQSGNELPFVARWQSCDYGTCGINPSVTGPAEICSGNSTVLKASGGISYQWNTGDTTSSVSVSPDSTTTYKVIVGNGLCFKDTSITVKIAPLPVIKLSGNTNICSGNSVVLTASGGSSYQWNTGATTSSVSVSPYSTTTYTVTVGNGLCFKDTSITIIADTIEAVSACCATAIKQGQSATLFASPVLKGYTYRWVPSTGVACDTCPNTDASPTATTWYYIIITDSDNCTSEDSVLITVKENCGNAFVPDAFSPNKDGQNDILYVRGDCINQMDWVIYDRWGEKVFESEQQSDGWDGTYRGQPMNTGTYVWYLKATLNDGATVEKKGNVTLVR